MSNEKQTSGVQVTGVGFTGLLTIAFVVLKLLGKIEWSWWWVLSPLWISAGLVVLLVIVMFAVYLLVELTK